ncbi:unnamed protein product [Notodromas monacha]|uniref:C2 NT-type domain-containing protein n=1 Tax=Notodromas monacha TaxID=399045 RepID=A0A7R9G9R7_9CRUS|nr:unnamed protein product [Notodromas monacha]CAG0914513.1 unnamed protein product [Notodromas monacha]
MPLWAKNKVFKFQVELTLEELTSVPFINAVLFAKIKLQNGGAFREISSREEVKDHKETNGGKSCMKLGYANIDLAEFAGGGAVDRKYLLEGYSGHQGQHNSTLRVLVNVVLQTGDPCFTRPIPCGREAERIDDIGVSGDPASAVDITNQDGSSALSDEKSTNQKAVLCPVSPVAKQRSPGLSHGPQAESLQGQLDLESCISENAPVANNGAASGDFEMGHARNSSAASRVSGYASMPGASHSRQSSSGDSGVAAASSHMRNPSTSSGHGSGHSNASSFERANASNARKKKITSTGGSLEEPLMVTSGGSGVSLAARVGSTRVDPQDVIEDLLQGTQIKCNESAESQGLQLIVHSDNSTSLGSSKGLHGKSNRSPVVISPTANADR